VAIATRPQSLLNLITRDSPEVIRTTRSIYITNDE